MRLLPILIAPALYLPMLYDLTLPDRRGIKLTSSWRFKHDARPRASLSHMTHFQVRRLTALHTCGCVEVSAPNGLLMV